MIELLAEQNLVWYLEQFCKDGEPLQGVKCYRGHDFQDIADAPRLTVIAVNKAGSLANNGIYDLIIQIIVVSSATDLVAHGKRVAAVLGIFSPNPADRPGNDGNSPMDVALVALNSPAAPGADFGISCMAVDDQLGIEEARDAQKEQHGHALHFNAVCNLV